MTEKGERVGRRGFAGTPAGKAIQAVQGAARKVPGDTVVPPLALAARWLVGRSERARRLAPPANRAGLDDPRLLAFARGLSLGALFGAALAGSTAWRWLHGRSRGSGGSRWSGGSGRTG